MKKLIGKKQITKMWEDRALLVESALEKNKLTKNDICEATGLSLINLNNLFARDRGIYAKYCVLRRTITDIAADNLIDIVMDKKHPKNYDASKEILKNFKTDLDDVLDVKDSEIKIETVGGKASSPVKIVFGNTSSKDNKE